MGTVIKPSDINRKLDRDVSQEHKRIYNFKAGGYVDRDEYNKLMIQLNKEQKLIEQGIHVKGPWMSKNKRITSMNIYDKTEKFEK